MFNKYAEDTFYKGGEKMNKVERFLTVCDIAVLRELKGKTLDYIRLNPDDPSHTVLQVVEFTFGKEKYYLYCDLEVIDFFGLTEDISYFEFTSVKFPFVDSCNLIENHVGLEVTGISEVKDTIKEYLEGKLDYEFSFTRGFIIHFGKYQMSLEKVSHFSELIRVRKGYDLVSKFSPVENYRNEFIPNTQLELSRDVIEIC